MDNAHLRHSICELMYAKDNGQCFLLNVFRYMCSSCKYNIKITLAVFTGLGGSTQYPLPCLA